MDLRLLACVVVGFAIGLGVAAIGFEVAWGRWAALPFNGVALSLVAGGMILMWDTHKRGQQAKPSAD
jgi:hypothetical protein